MNFAECKYGIYDKKSLAIIKNFELWKSELEKLEKPVQVIIDQKYLEYYMSNKLLNRRQTRWSEFFSKFNLKITYRPNLLNNKTNAFTRQSKNVFKKIRRQLQWQTVLKKKLDIQQLTFGPITNDNSNNSETISNPDLIGHEIFPKILLL